MKGAEQRSTIASLSSSAGRLNEEDKEDKEAGDHHLTCESCNNVILFYTSKDVVKAELNLGQKLPASSSSEKTWQATAAEVIVKSRETRSAKPEVLYRLTPPPKVPVVHQPTTPQSKAAASDQAAAADTGIVLPQQLLANLQEVDTASVQQAINPQQQPQNQQPVHDVQNVGEHEAALSDSEEMAEDKSVIPAPFSGKPGEDGDVWIRHFKNYCQYKEYAGPKSLALFKVLLIGNAALWLDTLPQETLTDFARLTAAFTERYEIPEVMKFKSAKEIFSRRQQVGESVDDYVAAIRRLARIIQVDDKITQYAVLNGFLPNIAAHVVSQRPQNLDAILEAGRIAELTNPTKSASDQVLTEQLADVRSELKRLATQWDKFTTAPVFDR